MPLIQKYFLILILGFTPCFSMRPLQASNDRGYIFSMSYLYWTPREDGLVYAFDNPGGLSEGTVYPIGEITAKDQKYHWDSGIRFGITYFLHRFDYAFNWTLFQSNSFTSTANHPLAAPLVGFVTAPFPERAQSRWNLHFNTFVLDTGYSIEFLCHFLLRPHIGILGAMINQKANYEYFNLALTGITSSIQRKHNFCGVGPRGGIDLQWCFCKNVSLISRASTSVVFGKINNQDQYLFPTTVSTFKENAYRARPIIDAYLGFGFDGCLGNHLYEISFGYAIEYCWNVFQSLLGEQTFFSPGGAWNDLSLQGLMLSLSLKI